MCQAGRIGTRYARSVTGFVVSEAEVSEGTDCENVKITLTLAFFVDSRIIAFL
jgi:hypothetical protein